MKPKNFWESKYDEFCNEVLEREIHGYQRSLALLMDEIIEIGEFYKEKTGNKELTPEEIILYCYINHELNVLDPVGFYPLISYEYASYARDLVHCRIEKGRKQFELKVEEEIENLVFSIGNRDTNAVITTCRKINKTVNEIYNSLDFIKNRHKGEFSDEIFWKKQLKTFQYKVLGDCRKEQASCITFLKEERDHLIKHKDENLAENYRDFVKFLYINHELNCTDPTGLYYTQFPYQYEEYAWKILEAYKSSSAKDFPTEAEKIIVDMFYKEGCAKKRCLYPISSVACRIKEKLDKIHK